MKNWHKKLVTLFFLNTLFNKLPALAEPGWIIKQASGFTDKHFGNAQTLYVTNNGMHFTEPRSGMNMFTRGPQWTVVIYSDKTKRYYQSQLQSWLSSLNQHNTGGYFAGATWKRGSQGTIAGVRAYEFIMDKPPVPHTTQTTSTVPSLLKGHLWVATDLAVPLEVSKIISQMYGIPDCQRIPLRVEVTEVGSQSHKKFDTISVNKANISEDFFSIPSSYTAVNQDKDVFIDQGTSKKIDKLLKELD